MQNDSKLRKKLIKILIYLIYTCFFLPSTLSTQPHRKFLALNPLKQNQTAAKRQRGGKNLQRLSALQHLQSLRRLHAHNNNNNNTNGDTPRRRRVLELARASSWVASGFHRELAARRNPAGGDAFISLFTFFIYSSSIKLIAKVRQQRSTLCPSPSSFCSSPSSHCADREVQSRGSGEG